MSDSEDNLESIFPVKAMILISFFLRYGIKEIISSYTRESGVRSLEREISNVLRKIAVDVVNKKLKTASISKKTVNEYLGIPKFQSDLAERTTKPGVVTGMAWTAAGGDILFIESSKMKGKGVLTLTGQLGDVMKESASAAFTYVKSHTDILNLKDDQPTTLIEKAEKYFIVQIIKTENWGKVTSLRCFYDFGIEIELWRIDDSVAAPRFNVIVAPNEWSKTINSKRYKSGSTQITDTKKLQKEFWEGFVNYLDENNSKLKYGKPGYRTYFTFRFPYKNIYIGCNINATKSHIFLSLYM